jgi:dienelactone hydrolase
MAWGNSEIRDFDAWRKAARQKVFDCMLMPPPPPVSGERIVDSLELRVESGEFATAASGNLNGAVANSPLSTFHSKLSTLNYQLLCEEQRDGYKARKIEIRLSRYYTVPAYVLIPDGKGPFPAINALHDHGGHLFIGKEKMIRPLACEDSTVIKDADEWVASLYEGQFVGDYLAKHGYVVFSADAPMWGERGQEEGPRRDRYDMIAGNMMMYGIDLSAYMTYDDLSGTEFLASMPEVDPQRIGCMGCSMGAYRAWMLSALSDRIKVGCAVCWMVTTDEQMSFKYKRTENGGFANCFPGLRRWMDYPHVASMACPKPMLFINGSQDKLFPVAGVEKAFNIMHETWRSQAADDKLETEIWDIPHSCPLKAQQRVLEFFKKHL